MGESLLITLREGFEAALIVAIVLAAVRRSSRPELSRWVWLGTAVALVVAALAGFVIHVTVDDLVGRQRARVFAVICFAAAALLTWMIFWMRRHARTLRSELEDRAGLALEQSGLALATLAFLAVAREGLETALFLISGTAASSNHDVLVGGLIGVALAVVLGVAVYHGSRFVPVRRFFLITGVLIVLFAAGLVSRGVMFLQSAGDIGSVNNAVYNLTGQAWLTNSTQSGRFLAGIFGWDPRPSLEQVVVYLGYLVPVLVAFFSGGPTRSTDDDQTSDRNQPPRQVHAPVG
jgi:high-affinity iron transporter